MLNPDTSSDSPSAKSKGERLVSARIELIHIIKIKGAISHVIFDVVIIIENDILEYIIIGIKIIIIILISYEIDWAIERILPIKEYFELVAQPEINIG